MQGVFMVTPEKETKMTEIQMFVRIFCHCHVGTSERENNYQTLCVGLFGSF